MPAPRVRSGHKYIKRTGTPGNYRYFYYTPDHPSRLREATDPEEHRTSVIDHTRRLLAHAIQHGHELNSATMQRIATVTGMSPEHVTWELSNMRARGRRHLARQGGSGSHPESAHYGHDYNPRHLGEVALDPEQNAGLYDELVRQKLREVHAGPSIQTPRSPREQPVARPAPQPVVAEPIESTPISNPISDEPTPEELEHDRRQEEKRRAARSVPVPASTPVSKPVKPARPIRTIQELNTILERNGMNLERIQISEEELARLGPETNEEKQFRLKNTLLRHGFNLDSLNLPDEAAQV